MRPKWNAERCVFALKSLGSTALTSNRYGCARGSPNKFVSTAECKGAMAIMGQ